MKIGNDHMFTTKVATYDFVELQMMVTDDQDYYVTGLGGPKHTKAYSDGQQSAKTVHRLVFCYKHLSHSHIAHEIEHAKNFILWVAGVHCSRKNDEPDSYLVDWITKWVYRKLQMAKIEIKAI